MADVRAYYDAGARLNAGRPLYPPDANPDVAQFYRYPPLLAIVFRPLALLPYEVVAPLWGMAMLAAFVLTLFRLGIRRETLLAVGILASPIGWSLALGQAQVLVTLLVALGTPAAVALATNIKLLPVLVGFYWLGRGDTHALGRLVVWSLLLVAVQFVLEPAGTLAFLTFPNLDQVGHAINLSPFAVSPVLWALLVAGAGILVYKLAPTRLGWAAAVALSVFANPRLLLYQYVTLLAAIGRPPDGRGQVEEPGLRG